MTVSEFLRCCGYACSLIARNRILHSIEAFKNSKEFRDREQSFDALIGTGKLEISIRIFHRGQAADKHPKSGAVHERHLTEIDDDVLFILIDELMELIVQRRSIGTSEHIPLHLDNRNTVLFRMFKFHLGVLS